MTTAIEIAANILLFGMACGAVAVLIGCVHVRNQRRSEIQRRVFEDETWY